MDCFLRDIYYYLFYHWCKNIIFDDNCQEKTNTTQKQLSQQYNQYLATISFWNHGVIEEQIIDTTNNEVIFYIHFEFINLFQAKSLTMDFSEHIKKITTKKNILIVCSCGITYSLFANTLEELIAENNLDYTVNAINLHSLETVKDTYDYICLAPQIRYLLPTLTKKHHQQIIAIDTGVFATNNGNALLSNFINTTLEESKYEKNIISL
ncbi:MAG: PTS sugar transporter subunit IIB [Coprobacillaceae bacterium]